ncbi:MAG: hypothetical protein HQK53_10225 [Oligoflexia bacterium]|nr:hypothetical protein [Oligoflexia bacterium]
MKIKDSHNKRGTTILGNTPFVDIKIFFTARLAKACRLPFSYHLLTYLFLSYSINGHGNYTLSDLEILGEEKNYLEFFQHAQDLRPVERGQRWKELVEQMALSYTYEQLKRSAVDDQTIALMDKLIDWPVLNNNLFFKRSRAKLGLR